jgi:hypothetical protein
MRAAMPAAPTVDSMCAVLNELDRKCSGYGVGSTTAWNTVRSEYHHVVIKLVELNFATIDSMFEYNRLRSTCYLTHCAKEALRRAGFAIPAPLCAPYIQ